MAKTVYRCTSRFEREARRCGFRLIAGVDEAGRGALFGPVCAAAVVLSPERPVRGLADSKTLTPEQRRELAVAIRESAEAWAVGTADASEIDRINIYQASRLAMLRAVKYLPHPPDYLLLDAMRIDFPAAQKPLIKGDARCRSIAAASILAKVHRDALLCELDESYPEYGLARHKGYFTPEHCEALKIHGPTPLHRMTFEPLRSWFGPPDSSPQLRQLSLFPEQDS